MAEKFLAVTFGSANSKTEVLILMQVVRGKTKNLPEQPAGVEIVRDV